MSYAAREKESAIKWPTRCDTHVVPTFAYLKHNFTLLTWHPSVLLSLFW